MTRDEIEHFVKAAINDYDIHEATRRIAEMWTEDVIDRRADARAEGAQIATGGF